MYTDVYCMSIVAHLRSQHIERPNGSVAALASLPYVERSSEVPWVSRSRPPSLAGPLEKLDRR